MTDRDPLGIVGLVVADKYRIERLVGEGGFAVVYRAQHTIWNKPVAIKCFNGLSAVPVEHRDRFQHAFIQEGALLTELSSETAAIVQARDVGAFTTPAGVWVPFMVLEWLEGQSLEQVLERDREAGRPPFTLGEAVRLLAQAAAALDVAHGKGIAHRDVKPANLFVLGDPRSGRATLKVLDFGVAKMMADNTQFQAALAKTGTAIASFTPQYGAPEQFTRAHGATGPWTDVYALALVASEMLSGRTALEGNDVIQLGYATANPARRPTPRALGVAVPDAVELVFQRALAVDPRERYARAGEFWSALDAATREAGLAASTTERVGSLDATELASLSGTRPEPSTVRAELPSQRGQSQRDLEGSVESRAATGGATALSPGVAARRSGPGLALTGFGLVAATLGGFFFLLRGQGTRGEPSPEPKPSGALALASAPVANAAPAPPKEPVCPDGMAKIPAGQFFQGSDEKSALDNERPAHNVKLDAFCIDLYEVTARQYKACSDVGKCKRASTEVEWPKITDAERRIYSPLCTVDDPDRLDHPINCVTWEMATLYCGAEGKRLPTEAEWEYATRGPDGRIYPWGDDEPTARHLNACGPECVAWGKRNKTVLTALYDEDDGYPTTAPIGRFEAGRSRFGPYDVVGNVWEWVADWYGPYTEEAKQNPQGPETGERKVIRGGGWNGSYATWLRPSFRYAQDPDARSHGIGFRCARSLSAEAD